VSDLDIAFQLATAHADEQHCRRRVRLPGTHPAAVSTLGGQVHAPVGRIEQRSSPTYAGPRCCMALAALSRSCGSVSTGGVYRHRAPWYPRAAAHRCPNCGVAQQHVW
jgi:hypothetical protein